MEYLSGLIGTDTFPEFERAVNAPGLPSPEGINDIYKELSPVLYTFRGHLSVKNTTADLESWYNIYKKYFELYIP